MSLKNIEKTLKARPALDAFGGALAGALSSTIVYPLEVAKVKLQAQRSTSGVSKYRGPLQTVGTVFKEEGLGGLYRGLPVTLLGVTPAWAVYFSTYGALKDRLGKLPVLEKGGGLLHLACSTGAGAATQFAVNPMWVIKNRLVTQERSGGEKVYKNTFHCGYKVAREEGITALWKGFMPSLLGVSHVMVQFPVYEKAKSFLADREGVSVEKLSPKSLILASAFSKVAATLATYPHETLRTRMQLDTTGQYNGLFDTARQIISNEGFSALYKGHGANLVRVIPSCVITFTGYELVKRGLHEAVDRKDEIVAFVKAKVEEYKKGEVTPKE